MDHVLILKADRLCAEALRHIVRDVFPATEVTEVRLLAEARLQLIGNAVDLMIAGTTFLDGDLGDLLAACGIGLPAPRRTLIVTGSRRPHLLARLNTFPIAGIFDSSSESASSLGVALRRVAEGGGYWSQSARDRLGSGATAARRVCASLTLTEQLVFAVIGDGSDDQAAAERLGLSSTSVQSVRRGLHRKLGVQQKGGLIRLAAQYGYVRFTADGVVRPGFEQLFATWRARRRKSPAVLAE